MTVQIVIGGLLSVVSGAGRGAVWTEERGTSDEGRRHRHAPRGESGAAWRRPGRAAMSTPARRGRQLIRSKRYLAAAGPGRRHRRADLGAGLFLPVPGRASSSTGSSPACRTGWASTASRCGGRSRCWPSPACWWRDDQVPAGRGGALAGRRVHAKAARRGPSELPGSDPGRAGHPGAGRGARPGGAADRAGRRTGHLRDPAEPPPRRRPAPRRWSRGAGSFAAISHAVRVAAAGRVPADGGGRAGRDHAGAGAAARPAGRRGRLRWSSSGWTTGPAWARSRCRSRTCRTSARPTISRVRLGHRDRPGRRPAGHGHPPRWPCGSGRWSEPRMLLAHPGGRAGRRRAGDRLRRRAPARSTSEVLFSGQSALPRLVEHASSYTVGALLLLLACKGLAYGLSLSSFRGGPVFPSLFLGAAGRHRAVAPARAGPWWPGWPWASARCARSCSGCRSPRCCWPRCCCTPTALAVMPLVIVAVVVAYVSSARMIPEAAPKRAARRRSRCRRPAARRPS